MTHARFAQGAEARRGLFGERIKYEAGGCCLHMAK